MKDINSDSTLFDILSGFCDEKTIFGEDVNIIINLSFKESISGIKKEINYSRSVYKGNKVVTKKNKTLVNIPAGVKSNWYIKLSGLGHIPTKYAIPGNLVLRIMVEK